METALEVMAEHTGESKPSRTFVIERTQARVIARFGPGAVAQPSRATAFRVLEDLERRHPLFRLSMKRNQVIRAARFTEHGPVQQPPRAVIQAEPAVRAAPAGPEQVRRQFHHAARRAPQVSQADGHQDGPPQVHELMGRPDGNHADVLDGQHRLVRRGARRTGC